MRLAASLTLLLAGLAHADPRAASDTETLSGTVLVWHDATLYTEASETAQAIRIGSLIGGRQVGEVVPMHVVAMKGAFVELEAIDDPECTASHVETTDDIAHVRLFVKRGDLAPVLTKPYTKEFPDGTRIALRPGVPVLPADGLVKLAIHGSDLTVEVAAASIGHSYKLDKAKAKAVSGRDLALEANTPVTLGGSNLTLGRMVAAGVERKGAIALVTVEERCAALTVAAPSKRVVESDDEEAASIGSGSGSGMGVLGLRNEDYLPIGTALSAGGHQVAIAAKPIYLPGKPSGKTVCIDRRVRLVVSPAGPAEPGDVDDKLRLCAPTAKVVHEKMRSASSANGTTGR